MYASVLMAATDKFVVALILSVVTTLLLVALVVLAYLAARPAMRQNKAEKLAEDEKAAKAAEMREKLKAEERAADEKATAEQIAALERAREISRKIEEAKENLSLGVIADCEPKVSEEPAETEREELRSCESAQSEEKEKTETSETTAGPEQSGAIALEDLTAVNEEKTSEEENDESTLETAATVAAVVTKEQSESESAAEEGEKAKKAAFGSRPERIVSPYSLSFKAKLIRSGEETQTFYGEIEDTFASFVDVRKTESWSKVRFKIKRETLAIMTFRGNTLCISLALDPTEKNLRGKCAKNMSGRRGFSNTPLLIKLKRERALSAAKDFIYELMASYDSERVYIDMRDYRLPYEEVESLAGRGLARLKPSAKE